MATYKTPGVYIEEIPKLPPSIAEVETAIPAFIGYTQRAGIDGSPLPTQSILVGSSSHTVSEALRITSLLDYVTYFGTGANETLAVNIAEAYENSVLKSRKVSATFTPSKNNLYYHMQMYFANGGGPCYIISLGTQGNAVVKDKLIAGVEMAKQYDEPTLLVIPEAANLVDVGGAFLPADAGEVYKAALTQAASLKDRFVIMDVCKKNSSNSTEVTAFRTAIGSNNLKYGAAYYPFLNTSLSYIYDLSATTTTIKRSKDLNNDGDILDPGEAAVTVAFSSLTSDVQNLIKQEADKYRVTLSPAATIAGVYASVDNARGVWKAPANVSLNYVSSLTDQVSDDEQDLLNVDTQAGKSINAIRSFTGKGNLVWGARTLAGNDNEWRYISVRRFFNMVEESAKKAIEALVFEPNDANTWTKIQGMIENYLLTLWREGALQGAKPEHAFYVSVGLGKTMTAQDILEGRLYVEIGMAAVRPAEFIILRFSHMMAQS